MTQRKAKKLNDKQFWELLKENGGIFARAARAAKHHFGVDITRQSVRERANKDPERLAEILEENVDVAEEGLLALMRSKDEKVRLRAIEFFLKSKGSDRGYFEKSKQTLEGDVAVTVRFIEEDARDNTKSA